MSKAAKQSLFILIFLLVGIIIYAGLVTIEKGKVEEANTKLTADLSGLKKDLNSGKKVISKTSDQH